MKKIILLSSFLGIFAFVHSQDTKTQYLYGATYVDRYGYNGHNNSDWANNQSPAPWDIVIITTSSNGANAQETAALTSNDGLHNMLRTAVVDPAIDRVAIDAKADGNFTIRVFSKNVTPDQFVELKIQDLTGKEASAPVQVAATETAEIKKQFSDIKTWNPETPNLYVAVVTVKDAAQKEVAQYKQRFGFRTVETRGADGLYVNGTRVVFKGVNRRSGEVSGHDAYLSDMYAMKDMNVNAVRLANYPADPTFLDLCDSIGLFVISELQSNTSNSDAGKKLIREMVTRDANHPAIVMWANAGDAAALDAEFKLNDVQQRQVIHPAAKGEENKKGADFSFVANSILYGTEALTPTEISNGLYNGGRAAGLDDFWSEMIRNPKFSGGFLSSYKDESNNDNGSGDNAKKGPNHYAIKEIWSPVIIDGSNVSATFNGSLPVENRSLFTNLDKYRFDWKTVLYPKATQKTNNYLVLAEGSANAAANPGAKSTVKVALPASFGNADALMMTVYDPNNRPVCTWTWAVHKPVDVCKTIPEVTSISTIMRTEDEAFLSLVTDGINYIFDKKTGSLTKVYVGKRDIPFIGPFLAGLDNGALTDFKYYIKDGSHIVETTYKNDNYLFVKWTFHTGELPRMDYQYSVKKPGDYVGITFKYPEEKIVATKWFGRGPWHVWKNRSKGMPLGVWERSTRADAKTSEVKGWHSDIYWVQFQTNMGNFTFYTDHADIYLQMFNPLKQGALSADFATNPFPENGNIGFMHSISGIGQRPADAPVSKSLKSVSAGEQLSGTIYMDFRW
jgi:hypothetical protein